MPCKVDSLGTIRYYDTEDRLHRKNGPAVEYVNGTIEYYLHGKLHRVGGPARVYANGDEVWAQDGQYHREDGPARTFADDGRREYWYHHRIVYVPNLHEFKKWILTQKYPVL